MKHTFLLLFLIGLISCNKDPNNPSSTNASGSISYKVNGNQVSINNIDILSGQFVVTYKQLKGSIYPNTQYFFQAQHGVNNLLMFLIVSDSLQKKNYHYDSLSVSSGTFAFYNILYNSQQSTLFRKGDYFDINITDYNNGKISGSFTAKLTKISQGTF